MNLTADEMKVIENIRRTKAEKEAKKIATLHLLKTAADYYEWLQKNDHSDWSLSTFSSKFNYQGDFCGWPPDVFYTQVLILIRMALGVIFEE